MAASVTRGSSQSAATLYNTLMTVYKTERMYRLFNRKRVLFNLIARKPQKVTEGLQFKYPVHVRGTSAGSFQGENDALTAGAAQQTDWLTFNMKTYAHQISLSGEVMWSTRDDKAALAKAWDFQAKNAVQDAMDDFNIAMYTPASGLLTKIKSSSAATTIVVENVRRLRVGQAVAVALISSEATTNGVASDIIADISGNTVTLTTGLTDYTVVNPTIDAYGNSLYGVYFVGDFAQWDNIWGLEDIISADAPVGTGNGAYGGVVRATAGNDWNKGRILDAAGNAIDHDIADEAADLVEVAGDGEVDYWLTTPEIFREINKLHVGTKYATMREKVGDGWFPTSLLAGKPVYKDKHCTQGTIYGIHKDSLWLAENKPLGWEAEDGSIMHRLEGYWGYQALLTRMFQLCGIPRNHVRIKNVAYTSYAS